MILRDMFALATNAHVQQQGRLDRYSGFASDSREVIAGELFVAVGGVHVSGHEFIHEAIQRGAAGVVIEAGYVRENAALLDQLAMTEAAILIVDDVRMALRAYARRVLQEWQPRVILVAGSAGKTTTKEAIATILGRHASTFRSWRNYNDLLGVPLTLGQLEPHHEFAVIEIGCDWPGEVAELANILQPEICVILNVLATHLDGLQSVEGIAAEFLALTRIAQHSILNSTDPLLKEMALTASSVTWFGDADESVVLTRIIQEATDHLVLAAKTDNLPERHYHFHGLHGNHWHHMVAAALTVAHYLEISVPESATALEHFQPLSGRMLFLDGEQQTTIIDDSHNAIPAAVQAALLELHRLGTLWQRPRIAILGDMLHLGDEAIEWHQQMGQWAAAHADYLITRGELAELSARTARNSGMTDEQIIVTHTAHDAIQAAQQLICTIVVPPIILVKGAPDLRMETVTAALLADSLKTTTILERQRDIWQREIVGELHRPTWLEINLAAIGTNTRAIAQHVGEQVAVMATLKADAYGHGALKVAHTVLHNGASWLGMATVSEAIPLRQAGITAPILIYGYLPPWQAREAVRYDLRATVYAMDTIRALSRAATASNIMVKVHVKIDTGMGRLGLRAEDPQEIIAFIREIRQVPGISIEGLYTHFATADEPGNPYTQRQLIRFQTIIAALKAVDLCPSIIHAANSAATLVLPEAHFSLVRPGIALYGLDPAVEVPLPAAFRPALSFKTKVAQVKNIPAGEGISYGTTYITTAPERIAVLPVGYADGFRRGPANWGEVLIRGKRAPIRGRVCMDQTMVSVEHIPDACAGDEVVLIGEQGSERITAEMIAQQLGTSNYEVVAALLARVPRING